MFVQLMVLNNTSVGYIKKQTKSTIDKRVFIFQFLFFIFQIKKELQGKTLLKEFVRKFISKKFNQNKKSYQNKVKK